MPERVAKVVCPWCHETVVAYRTHGGRILVTTALGLILGGVGAFIGAGIGIASGGWGIPATIPMAAVGLVVGAGVGYIIADKKIDKPRCPKCGKPIDLGI